MFSIRDVYDYGEIQVSDIWETYFDHYSFDYHYP